MRKKRRQPQVVQAYIRKLSQAPVLGQESDLESLFTDTLAQAIQEVGAERGIILLRQADRQERIAKSVQYGEEAISRTIINKVMQSNQPLVIRNAMTDRHFARAKSVMKGRIRSVLCVPLREKGEAIGVIYLEDRTKRGKFSQQDLISLQNLSQQVSETLGLKMSD